MTIAETNVNIFSRVLDFDAILQLLEIGMYYQKKNMYDTSFFVKSSYINLTKRHVFVQMGKNVNICLKLTCIYYFPIV